MLFFMIDKRDEYQLVNFILKFKSFQFLSGVISSRLSRSKSGAYPR